jgi:putative isomerase
MSLTSRRDVLAGLTAVGAASLVPAFGQQRQASAAVLLDYFAANAPQLLRPPAGILKYPSISPSLPGKRYATQLWDWDTLWTSQGLFRLAALKHDESLKQKLCEHVSGSLLNFLDHADADGRMPIMMQPDNRDPLGAIGTDARSRNQAKPVFGQIGLLAADQRGSVDWLAPRFDTILRFYDSWKAHNSSNIGLLVWGDDVAIGDDNDPTTFGRPFFSSANLLLNCLYYQDLRATAELARRLGRAKDHDRLEAEAETLAQAIRTYCWDARDSYFYSADVQCVDRRAELIPSVTRGMDMSWKSLPMRIQMFTGFLPLWCGIASAAQAEALVRVNYVADDRLCARWGVRSVSSRESMYSLAFSSNPSNWLGPVWIIVNYLAWKGLQRYGFQKEADALADGSLNEYYHPDTGAALSHKGFMDWNLLVLEMM